MLDNQNKNLFKKLKLSIYSKIIKTLIANVYRMSKHWLVLLALQFQGTISYFSINIYVYVFFTDGMAKLYFSLII